jgi:NAD(P)-dependent dehydrogenase (short-subunit alcohol dehydrogenase family)
MTRFAGKLALVTGAGRGMGAAVATALAREGAAVGLIDVVADRVERERAALERDGARAFAAVADVSSEASFAAAVEQLAEQLGGVDLMASFAGVVGYGPAHEFAESEWDRILGVNAKGAFLSAKLVVPHLRRRGGGAILLTSSVLAHAAEAQGAAYAASKGAVEAMTRSIALDYAAEGIRVNCIAPGAIRTELLWDAARAFGEASDELIESWGEQQPIGRLIEPEEVAELALFLLGDGAASITGSSYRIDGGSLGKLG